MLYLPAEEVEMAKTFMLIFIVFWAPIALGESRFRVCEADGITPFNGREIMVGTRLTFIVSSDQSVYWSGGLFINGQDRALGMLSARGGDPNTGDWSGSHYEEAGDQHDRFAVFLKMFRS